MSVSPGHLDSLLNVSFTNAETSGVSFQSQTGAGLTSYSTVTVNATGTPSFGLIQGVSEVLNITGFNDTDNSITYSVTADRTTVQGITEYVVGYSSNSLLLNPGRANDFGILLSTNNSSIINATSGIISSAPIAANTSLTFTPSGTSTVTPGALPTPPATPPVTPPTINTVTLHGSSLQYIVADNNGSFYVQDNVAARDGTPALGGANEVIFTNGMGVFDPTGSAEDVSRLYHAALNRAPDVNGLEFWSSAIDGATASLTNVASSLATSPEFIQHYGALSDAAFVNQLYQNVLGRPADTAGAQFWDGQLAAGVTRGAVLIGFAESPENKANTVTFAGDQNNAEAYRLYQAGLNRAPDASGLAFWSAALTNGATPAQVAQDFINSPEFQQKFGALSGSAFVSQLYQNVLHRAADPSGLQFWTNTLQQTGSEATVLVGLSDSLENRIQTAGATHANWVFIPS